MQFQTVPISCLNVHYETLTRSSLHVVLTDSTNTNFASHNLIPEPKVALYKDLV